ncbi:hypothetical protein IV203_010814 [Nitzschia inconspicua]|uniref:Uncharacterized protein n=1 Tax=Nitzschia inconspicua TaxID=303405 RepID=A0A9K3KWR7_9STRA|nr:hypothetical protein IV203_010814 [Nitzschia inconspicua]
MASDPANVSPLSFRITSPIHRTVIMTQSLVPLQLSINPSETTEHFHEESQSVEIQVPTQLNQELRDRCPYDEIPLKQEVVKAVTSSSNNSNNNNNIITAKNDASSTASPSSSVVVDDSDEDEEDCYIENTSNYPKTLAITQTPQTSHSVKSVTDTPETSMMQDYSDEDDDDGEEEEQEIKNRDGKSPLNDVEDYQNVLTVPELSHPTIGALLLPKETTIPNNHKDWSLTSLDSVYSEDGVRYVGQHDAHNQDTETFDHMEDRTLESEVEGTTKLDGVVVGTVIDRVPKSSVSVGSEDAVVPNYNLVCSVRKKKKEKRTLERLLAGTADDSVIVTDDDSDDDDDNSTGPPTVGAAFEELWDENQSQFTSVDYMSSAVSIDSDDDEVGLHDDIISTEDNNNHKNEVSSTSKNPVRVATAKLFGGISNTEEPSGVAMKRRSGKSRDETSTSSSTKEKVVAAVSTLQKHVSKKLVVVGEAVSPAVASLQRSVSSSVTVVRGNITKGILSRGKSVNSAAGTSAATPTTAAPESIIDDPDLEAQEDDCIIEEEEEEEELVDDDMTLSTASIDVVKEELMTPRMILWVLIVSLMSIVFVIFVAMLSIFAKHS